MTTAASLSPVPSLTLVRPLRGQAETRDHAEAPPASPADASASMSAEASGDVSANGSADAEALGRGAHPLAADDRALLESMAPALATALVEVLVGARAPVSIEKWVEAPLFERIVEHTRIRRSLSQGNPHEDRPLAASRARICEVSDCAVEIALVVNTSRRPRALAMRLTRRRSRWKLTEFLSI